MKALYSLTLSLLLLIGCTANQQTKSFNTIYAVQATTTSAIDSYNSLVIQGLLPTNDVPKVSRLYNQFQASTAVALDAVEFNTNALAPESLIIESENLIRLINTLKKKEL